MSPAPNDNWANAADLGSAGSGTVHVNNDGATTEGSEPAPTAIGVPPEATLWWKWTCPLSAPNFVAFSTIGSPSAAFGGSNMDTVLAVYTGASLAALTEVVSNDDSGVSGFAVSSVVEFAPVAGTTYYIQAGSYPAGGSGDRGVIWLSWSTGASSGMTPYPAIPACGCTNLVGSVFPDTTVPNPSGTAGHRPYFGPDQRGGSFWLGGSHSTSPHNFIEEYSFPGLTLLQRFDLTEPPYVGAFGGFADFWGGDGSGGITYLYGNDIVRRDSGGAYTRLSTPATFGAVFVCQDAANDRLIVVRRTNNSSPYTHVITAIEMDGTNTDLGSFTFTQVVTDYPAVSGDGAVWMCLGSLYLGRWHPVDGFSSANVLSGTSPIVPRPDGSVWVQVNPDPQGMVQVNTDMTTAAIEPCPTVGIDGPYNLLVFADLKLALDRKKQVVLGRQIPQDSSSVQWDLYLLKKCGGGWGRRRFGGAGF